MGLAIQPTTLKRANDFVESHHRHSGRTVRNGGKFAIAAVNDDDVIGVAIVGNPVSATLMDGFTAEVLRVCVSPDAPKNACSILYGRCWRIWQQMGGRRMVTYTHSKAKLAAVSVELAGASSVRSSLIADGRTKRPPTRSAGLIRKFTANRNFDGRRLAQFDARPSHPPHCLHRPRRRKPPRGRGEDRLRHRHVRGADRHCARGSGRPHPLALLVAPRAGPTEPGF